MMPSNILFFLVEFLTQYDTIKFHNYWSSNKVVAGGGIIHPTPAIPDSEKPSLFRVNELASSEITPKYLATGPSN